MIGIEMKVKAKLNRWLLTNEMAFFDANANRTPRPSLPALRCIAWTKSEARADFKRALGIRPKGRLPVGVFVQCLGEVE